MGWPSSPDRPLGTPGMPLRTCRPAALSGSTVWVSSVPRVSHRSSASRTAPRPRRFAEAVVPRRLRPRTDRASRHSGDPHVSSQSAPPSFWCSPVQDRADAPESGVWGLPMARVRAVSGPRPPLLEAIPPGSSHDREAQQALARSAMGIIVAVLSCQSTPDTPPVNRANGGDPALSMWSPGRIFAYHS